MDYTHAYYHVTCRDDERKAVFKDERDRSVLVENLQISLTIWHVILHCFVLMDDRNGKVKLKGKDVRNSFGVGAIKSGK